MEQLKMRKPVRRVDISINMEATGANIKRMIKASGYSVRDIMAITGISTEQAVYKWFRGESIPAIETMLILCNALSINRLFNFCGGRPLNGGLPKVGVEKERHIKERA